MWLLRSVPLVTVGQDEGIYCMLTSSCGLYNQCTFGHIQQIIPCFFWRNHSKRWIGDRETMPFSYSAKSCAITEFPLQNSYVLPWTFPPLNAYSHGPLYEWNRLYHFQLAISITYTNITRKCYRQICCCFCKFVEAKRYYLTKVEEGKRKKDGTNDQHKKNCRRNQRVMQVSTVLLVLFKKLATIKVCTKFTMKKMAAMEKWL